MESMYTKEGIPVVMPETLIELKNLLMVADNKAEKRWLEEIMAENPLVAEFISSTAMRYKAKGNEEVLRVADNMVYMYRLLRTQGESNKLIEMLERQGAIRG